MGPGAPPRGQPTLVRPVPIPGDAEPAVRCKTSSRAHGRGTASRCNTHATICSRCASFRATFTRREDSDLACRTKDEIVKDSFDYRSDVVFPNRPHAPVGVPGDVSVKPACPMHRYSVSWPRPARVG